MIQRGHLRVVDLEPARGSETNKRRPDVIVSRDASNTTRSGRVGPVVGGLPQNLVASLDAALRLHLDV